MLAEPIGRISAGFSSIIFPIDRLAGINCSSDESEETSLS